MASSFAHPFTRVAADADGAPAWLDKTAYPFRNRYREVLPGVRVHYVDEGHGDVVLFVHGTPTWSFEWRHAIAQLSNNHRCIAIDHLGFGLSDRPDTFDYSPESHSRVLRAFVEQLGLRDITLVVHDYGGPIALPLAFETPSRVRRLVLLNTWMWSFQDDPSMRRKAAIAGGRLGSFLYRHANLSLRVIMPSAYGDRRKLSPAIHAQYLAPFPDAESRGRVLHALARALLGSGDYFQSLWQKRTLLEKLPALIIWGMRDSAFTPPQLERLRSAFPGARVVQLPVGHWPQEEDPEAVTRALSEFLAA